MALVQFTAASYHYDQPYRQIFNNLDLTIDTQWRCGLVGRNGTGKSTLLKLILGLIQIQAGSASLPINARLFPVQPAPGLTTRQAVKAAVAAFDEWEAELKRLSSETDEASIKAYCDLLERYQAAGGYEIDGLIEREASLLKLPPELLDQPFEQLSGGEQTRAMIIPLFLDQNSYGLIDEPTNHLDVAGRRTLAAYLANKQGYLLVSHDRKFLDLTTDHIISINKDDVRVNQGNFSQWRKHMDETLAHEARTRTQLVKEVRQLSAAAREKRGHAASKESEKIGDSHADTGFIGHRAAKQMKRAKSIEKHVNKKLEEKQGLLKNQEKIRALSVTSRAEAPSQLIVIQNISFGYSDGPLADETMLNEPGVSTDKPLFGNFSLTINTGDRIAITGANGSGKSTLFQLLTGALVPTAGVIARPGYITISQSYQTPLWKTGELSEHLKSAGLNATRVRQYMGILGFGAEVYHTDLSQFSQGELKKIDLIRSLSNEADLYLWDEPLNYIDLYTREQLEEAIQKSNPTMMFIEHDESFVEQIATRVIDANDFIH